MRCSSCATELPANSRFCLTCGSSVPGSITENDATIAMPVTPISNTPQTTPMSGSRFRASGAGGSDTQRFPPGTLVANRYRVVARLGKGGMGEVFRADDLILGQTVALKFLPDTATNNPNLLARFYDEVRIARQVTHPNVCRVHDIGELNGQPYLSMAYVDGEDLGALLRRIGRLPADKATEFSRKLCAGLASAHAQGVLHRDLKPANIMIDSQGQVVITDFGLAGIAAELHGAEVRNGTPAYMAPEQLTGEEVSARSDIYSLGLVMYEMFTGRAPFQADTVADMLRVRQQSRATNPSTLVHDMDPAVERAIMRCLDPDPKMRPQTALAVAAALPGGDPLAAALAAGETPSPEVVAASGSNEGVRPVIAIGVLAGIVALAAVLLVFTPRFRLVNKVPLENPPEVLAAKARDIARKLGYPDKPADSAYGFDFSGYTDHMESKVHGMAEWDKLLSRPPSALEFWYRQSPRPMQAISITGDARVTRQDPPMRVSGMVYANLDPDGRLTQFQAIPPQLDTSGNSARSADWSALFAAADLDISKFQPTAPQWVPVVDTDSSAAWTGTYPGHPDLPIRVEAAAWHGKLVYFDIIWPWTKPTRLVENSGSIRDRAAYYVRTILIVAIIIVAIVMARQNVKANRGDHRGAVRLGVFAGVTALIGWVLSAHHVAAAGSEQSLISEALAGALARGVILWGVYMALEPWVRRHWPQTLVTWTRLLSGRLRDPMIGRDLLFSVLFGLAYCVLIVAFEALDQQPSGDFHLSNLLGGRMIASGAITHVLGGLISGPEFLFMLFLLRVVLRKQWLAAIVFVLIWALMLGSQGGGNILARGIFFAVIFGLIVTILMRFGLFAIVVTVSLIDWINDTLLTTDFGAWYGLSSVFLLLVLGAMTAYGFWTSLGNRTLLNDQILER
jgi:hypothetical protein